MPTLTFNMNVLSDHKANEYFTVIHFICYDPKNTKENWRAFEILRSQGISENLSSLLILKILFTDPWATQTMTFSHCARSNQQTLQGERAWLSVIPAWNEASPNLVKAFQSSVRDAFSHHWHFISYSLPNAKKWITFLSPSYTWI